MSRALFTVIALLVALLSGCRSETERQSAASASARLLPSAAPNPSAALEVAPPPPAPQWTRPLLFRVATKGKHFHLFGTIHLPDSRLDVFPPALEAAFSESDSVYTEIPLDDATQAAIAPSLMLPAGQTLSQVLPPDLHQQVARAFQAAGVPPLAIEGLKPWAVSVQLAVLDRMITLALKKPIDAVIFQRAVKAGKPAGGIETADEQLALFDTLKPKEQIELLRQTLELRERMRKEKRDLLEELLVAYLEGADERLLTLIQEGFDEKDPLAVKVMKRIFTDRNASMTERMIAKVGPAPDKVHFFAVGSGHLLGDDGIVARLRRRGLEVTRVVP